MSRGVVSTVLVILLCVVGTHAYRWELQFSSEWYCQDPPVVITLTSTTQPPYACQSTPGSLCLINPQDPSSCVPQAYYSLDGESNVLTFYSDQECSSVSGPPLGCYSCNSYFGQANSFKFRSINYTRIDS